MPSYLTRDRLAGLAGLAAPLALAAVLVPFRASFPNTDAARAVAAGGSAPALIDQVSSQLVHLLSLRSCTFQYGVAGLGRPARLHRDGSITIGQRRWAADSEDLPADTGLELLVEGGGVFQGRFLMTPAPGARPALERRLLAVAFAEQVGAALASSQRVDQR
jgi:hypothetical protein